MICSDTNPFEPDSETLLPPKHKNMGKSSMSFLTALSLSFNNLRTKKARTLLTSFAGSIGIIGIALILALSSGVNEYIQNMEEETLSEYPLQIQSTGFDLTSMMVGSQNAGKDSKDSGKKNEIKVQEVVTNMFSTMNSNDLASLKKYLDGGADAFPTTQMPSNIPTPSRRRSTAKTAIPSARCTRTSRSARSALAQAPTASCHP